MIAKSTSWVRAPRSGIVSAKVKLGSSVTAGQRLAVVGDPLGNEEISVVAPFDGIVIGCSNLPLSHEGDALFHLGGFKSMPKAEDILETFVATHDDDIGTV